MILSKVFMRDSQHPQNILVTEDYMAEVINTTDFPKETMCNNSKAVYLQSVPFNVIYYVNALIVFHFCPQME